MHALKDLGGEEPLKDLRSTDAERVLQILVGAGGVTVQRDAEAEDFDFHDGTPFRLESDDRWPRYQRLYLAFPHASVTRRIVELRVLGPKSRLTAALGIRLNGRCCCGLSHP